jgi:hypothetical protein
VPFGSAASAAVIGMVGGGVAGRLPSVSRPTSPSLSLDTPK